jgi:hypothetical protein
VRAFHKDRSLSGLLRLNHSSSLRDLAHVLSEGSYKLADLVLHFAEEVEGKSVGLLGSAGLLDRDWHSWGLVLEDLYLSLELDDFPFHLLGGFIDLRELDPSLLEIESVLIEEVQLLSRHVPVPVSLAGVESAELPEPVSQLRPLLFQLLDLSLQLPALGLVVLQLLLLGDLDFLQVETEVLGDSVELSQNFVLSKDVLEVGAGSVVLFGQLVKVVVGDRCLVGHFLNVHQQRRVLILPAHFPQAQRQFRNHGVLVLGILRHPFPQQPLLDQLVPQPLKFSEGVGVLLLELGLHLFHFLGHEGFDLIDGLAVDEKLRVEAIAFLDGWRSTAWSCTSRCCVCWWSYRSSFSWSCFRWSSFLSLETS